MSEISSDSVRVRKTASKPAWLIPVAGPPLRAIELKPKDSGLIIGRSEECDLHLGKVEISFEHPVRQGDQEPRHE